MLKQKNNAYSYVLIIENITRAEAIAAIEKITGKDIAEQPSTSNEFVIRYKKIVASFEKMKL